MKRQVNKKIDKNNNLFNDKKYIYMIGAIIVFAFVYFYGKPVLSSLSYFKIKNYVITGNGAFTYEDIKGIISQNNGDSTIDFDKKKAVKLLIKTGLIKNVIITIDYPSTVRISIRERVAVAIIRFKKENSLTYFLVDDEAKVITKRTNVTGIKLPIIVLPETVVTPPKVLRGYIKKTLYTLGVISFKNRNDLRRIKLIKFVPEKSKVFIWLDSMRQSFIVKDFLRVKNFLEMKHLLKRREITRQSLTTIDLRFNDIIARW